MLDFDGTRRWRRREAVIAATFLFLAVILLLLPSAYQEPLRAGIRNTVLRPFIAAQARIAADRALRADISQIRAQRDSLAALAVAQRSLAEENRQLRAMLGLGQRTGAEFVGAQVLRVGTTGTKSTFLIDVGTEDGIGVGSPIIAPEGLLGVVVRADAQTSQAIDWTSSEFKVGAMTIDGTAFGIVESMSGRFGEVDILLLTGAPFHSDVRPGSLIVTSGRGQRYPRGIPVGTVLGIQDADTGWRKSYLMRPAVRPEATLHVLVGKINAVPADVSELWQLTVSADSVSTDTTRSDSDDEEGRRDESNAR